MAVGGVDYRPPSTINSGARSCGATAGDAKDAAAEKTCRSTINFFAPEERGTHQIT
jgi:hypothetical protein